MLLEKDSKIKEASHKKKKKFKKKQKKKKRSIFCLDSGIQFHLLIFNFKVDARKKDRTYWSCNWQAQGPKFGLILRTNDCVAFTLYWLRLEIGVPLLCMQWLSCGTIFLVGNQ
jgi:hypothetical protein